MTRFFLIVVLFATVGVCIVLKAAIIMFKERGYWNEVADRFVKENVLVDIAKLKSKLRKTLCSRAT